MREGQISVQVAGIYCEARKWLHPSLCKLQCISRSW